MKEKEFTGGKRGRALSEREQPLQRHSGMKENGVSEGSPCDWRTEWPGQVCGEESPGDEVGKVDQEKLRRALY